MDPRLVVHIIEGLWLVWLGYWIFRAFGNKRTIYARGRGMRLLFLLLVALAWMMAGSLRLVARHRLFYENIFTQSGGILLCTAGIALAIWARVILGGNWSGIVTLKENHELIKSGPYRFMRHPIYSGILLGMLGSVIALNPFLSGVVFMAIAVIGLRLKSLLEERIMLRTFPDQYPDYMKHVSALIPGVW